MYFMIWAKLMIWFLSARSLTTNLSWLDGNHHIIFNYFMLATFLIRKRVWEKDYEIFANKSNKFFKTSNSILK